MADARGQHLTESRQPTKHTEPNTKTSTAPPAQPDLEPTLLDTPPTPVLDEDVELEAMDDEIDKYRDVDIMVDIPEFQRVVEQARDMVLEKRRTPS